MITAAAEPTESVRNRLLRLIDWRFLLPAPTPRRAVCFTGGDLAEALALVSGEVVTPDDGVGSPGSCDLAAVVDPDASALDRAFAALRPGGSLYVEWRTRMGVSPASVDGLLTAAGFVDPRFYTPHPTPARAMPERWIPLDAPGAILFAFRTRPPARTALRRIARRLQRETWMAGRRFRVASPLCAIATAGPALSGPPPTAPPSTACPWDAAVRDGWATWGFGPTSPDRLASLLLTGGARTVNKVVALVFEESAQSPRIAVKMPRAPESIATLEREAETLIALADRVTPVPGVARVLFRGGGRDSPHIGQTVVLGRRVAGLLAGDKLRTIALQATDWLAGLAESTTTMPPNDAQASIVQPVIADFEANFGSVIDPGALRDVANRLHDLPLLPAVCEHRDFAPWNLLLADDGALNVLDWESSELNGMPGLDLIYLLAHLAIHSEGAHSPGADEDAYTRSLRPETPFGAIAAECWTRYAGRLGIPGDILPRLRLLTWMLHSRSAHQRLVDDFGGPPPPDALRASRFLRFWRVETALDG